MRRETREYWIMGLFIVILGACIVTVGLSISNSVRINECIAAQHHACNNVTAAD